MALNGVRAHVAIENLVHDVDQIIWNLPGQRCEKVYAVERYITDRPFPDLIYAEHGAFTAAVTAFVALSLVRGEGHPGSWDSR